MQPVARIGLIVALGLTIIARIAPGGEDYPPDFFADGSIPTTVRPGESVKRSRGGRNRHSPESEPASIRKYR